MVLSYLSKLNIKPLLTSTIQRLKEKQSEPLEGHELQLIDWCCAVLIPGMNLDLVQPFHFYLEDGGQLTPKPRNRRRKVAP